MYYKKLVINKIATGLNYYKSYSKFFNLLLVLLFRC